jgi:hypothetical protein
MTYYFTSFQFLHKSKGDTTAHADFSLFEGTPPEDAIRIYCQKARRFDAKQMNANLLCAERCEERYLICAGKLYAERSTNSDSGFLFVGGYDADGVRVLHDDFVEVTGVTELNEKEDALRTGINKFINYVFRDA